MRAAMIFAGAALLHRFEWVIYIFGAFLVYTGFKLAFGKDAEVDPDKNPMVNLAKRFMPISPQFHGDKFFIWENGKRVATPLFVVLLIVETTDVVFAIDSIPAIFGVTKDPFIVFTSNVFAILGLRSLYFALSGVMGKFHYLKTALAFILAFIGVKMLLGHTDYKIETPLALGAVVGSLLVAVLMSLVKLKTWQSGLLLTMLLGAIGLVLDFSPNGMAQRPLFTAWHWAVSGFHSCDVPASRNRRRFDGGTAARSCRTSACHRRKRCCAHSSISYDSSRVCPT
jgi:predicted tellurium resistance membrane protein TerC